MASFRFCNDSCRFSGVASQTAPPGGGAATGAAFDVAFPLPFAAKGMGPVPSQDDTSSLGEPSAETFVCNWKRCIRDGACEI